MKKLGKIVLLMPVLMMFVVWAVLITVYGGHVGNDHPLYFFGVLSFALIPVQWIFYITNVFRNTRITTKSQRFLWTWMLLGGSVFVFPFYWYFHIWRNDDKPQEEQTPTPPAVPISEVPRFKSKPSRIIILVIGVLPIVFFALAFVLFSYGLPYSIFYILGVPSYVLLVGLIIFYIIDVFRNRSVAHNQRIFWTVLLIFGNLITFPFYWYIYIWNKPCKV